MQNFEKMTRRSDKIGKGGRPDSKRTHQAKERAQQRRNQRKMKGGGR